LPVYTLHVNGRGHRVEVDAEMPLLWVLRDQLHLTGTKFGCGEGICGACTVHEEGRAVRSCTIPIESAVGKRYVTIEGLGSERLHPCQQAWLDEDVAQCGYCQVGMIMTAAAFLSENATPSDAEIDAAMANSVCRCGTYNPMRRAIHRAALAFRSVKTK
jgi:isoquinoline 1-oxidoreductase alpha subunit